MRDGMIAFAPSLADQNDGFNPRFFELMAAVEPTHFWFVSRNDILHDVLRKNLTLPRKILEIGCGTGFVLSKIRTIYPHAHLSGSDIYTEGLGFAAKRVPDATLFQMDARHIPFDQEFDLIGAFDVLEHIEEDEMVLAQMYQACTQGGRLLLTVPQHRWMWSRMDDFAHHQRRYTRTELIRKLEHAGFQVEYATSFVSLLLPLMWAMRSLGTSGTEMQDQMAAAGLAIGKFSNKLLSAAMAVERALIDLGIRFPFGGSLLMLARRPDKTDKAL